MESNWTETSHKIAFEVSSADVTAAWEAIANGFEIIEQHAIDDGRQVDGEVRNELAALAGCAFFALRRLRVLMSDFDASNLAVQSIGLDTLQRHMKQISI